MQSSRIAGVPGFPLEFDVDTNGYNGWTPVQQRMLVLLSDGLPHTKIELHGCLDDEYSPIEAIRYHICTINKRLGPLGQEIVCVSKGHAGSFYRHVRHLASPYDGRK